MDRFGLCCTLAREAGALAHRGFGHSAAALKGRHDVVTAMDREVERFVRNRLAAACPDDAIFGEEEGGRRSGERVWLVDPIDGTANYARGIPHYAVSIAYLEHGVPVAGAVCDPSHDWLYAAARGHGAFRNDVRLAVSACAQLNGATVECGWSPRRTAAAYTALVSRVLEAGGAVRRAGSGALGLADVAAGRVEAYCELHINAWDCAAGILLVTEAGGRTSDFFAGEGIVNGNPLLATNAALCAKLSVVVGIPVTC